MTTAEGTPPPDADGPAATVRFRITRDDFRRAQWLHIKPRPVFVVLGALVLALMLIVAVYALLSRDSERAALIIVVAVSYLVFTVVAHRRRVARAYDQTKALHDEFAMTVDGSGIHTAAERGQSTMLYGDILRIREDERVMLIYHADNLFNVIPKSSPPLIAATALIVEFHRKHQGARAAETAG